LVTSDVQVAVSTTNGSVSLRDAAGNPANNTVEVHIRPNQGKSGYTTFTENAVADKYAIGCDAGNNSLLIRQGSFSGTVRAAFDAGGQFQTMPTGGGTILNAFACRVWASFNGTGTPSIRGSGGVSSVTRNGTGDYNVNFSTAMPDTNYAAVPGGTSGSNGTWITYTITSTQNTGSVQVLDQPSAGGGGGRTDKVLVNVAVFR
jgi:hypothetical protein